VTTKAKEEKKEESADRVVPKERKKREVQVSIF
jgi:hypothetical protein